MTTDTAATPAALLAYGNETSLPITSDMLLTVGQLIHPSPRPLPDPVVGRFAATVARHPVEMGRILRHALHAARRMEGHDHA